MKVLHMCTGWPLSYQGGITNYVRQLAFTQFENGVDVCVLGAKDTVEYPFRYFSFKSKIIPFSYTPLKDKLSLKWLDDFFKKEKFDLIHIHALEYVDWDLFEVIKDHKYIVSLHDYCFICPRVTMFTYKGEVCCKYDEKKCSLCISYLERIKIIRRCFEKLNNIFGIALKIPHVKQNITKERYKRFITLLNNADYILPVSKKVEEIYKRSGVLAQSKVLHIGNISADSFNEQYTYDSSPHIIKIVFLGRLTKDKGAELFLKIAHKMKSNKNIEFHFMGNAGAYSNKILNAGIINHGKYNQSQLNELLSKYDMGMVLSIWEDNGPQVVMELLNNHVPVIGTKMGGIPDFVDDSNGFVFDPYDEKEQEKLYLFLNELTIQKIKILKNNIKRTITPHQHYMQLMKVYNEVLNTL